VNTTIFLVVELFGPVALEAAKMRGIRAWLAEPVSGQTVLVASMFDYDKILEWYCQAGTQLRRTFGAEVAR
jgi:hypothetical protein